MRINISETHSIKFGVFISKLIFRFILRKSHLERTFWSPKSCWLQVFQLFSICKRWQATSFLCCVAQCSFSSFPVALPIMKLLFHLDAQRLVDPKNSSSHSFMSFTNTIGCEVTTVFYGSNSKVTCGSSQVSRLLLNFEVSRAISLPRSIDWEKRFVRLSSPQMLQYNVTQLGVNTE